MKIALAQINTTVGDLAGNEALIRSAYERGVDEGVDLVVTPELAVTGYPPRDLLLKSGFVEKNLEVVKRLADIMGETGLLVGCVGKNENQPGRNATNSVALLHEGRMIAARTKTLLPTYDVFDEDRYFEPATGNSPIEFKGRKLGLTICEDAWNDADFWRDRRYHEDPATQLANSGAELLINVSASPWHLGKDAMRREMLASLAAKSNCPLIYCNAVGGNDELVFDGGSLVLNAAGKPIAQGANFAEDLLIVDVANEPVIDLDNAPAEESLHDALVLGVRDYLGKCGFKSAVIGLSGGIDSAVTASLAVAALDSENVRGVAMPSQYSSEGSIKDARALADPRAAGLIAAVDLFLPNRAEMQALTENAIAVAPRVAVIVKCGAEGAEAMPAGGAALSCPASPADPLDTTGAGDAFNAGFLVAWRAGRDLADCLTLANRCGALAVARLGGAGQLSDLRDLAARVLPTGQGQ